MTPLPKEPPPKEPPPPPPSSSSDTASSGPKSAQCGPVLMKRSWEWLTAAVRQL